MDQDTSMSSIEEFDHDFENDLIVPQITSFADSCLPHFLGTPIQNTQTRGESTVLSNIESHKIEVIRVFDSAMVSPESINIMPVSDSLEVGQLAHSFSNTKWSKVPDKADSLVKKEIISNKESPVKPKSADSTDLKIKADSKNSVKVPIKIKSDVTAKTESPVNTDKEGSKTAVKTPGKAKLPKKGKPLVKSVVPSTKKAPVCQVDASIKVNGANDNDAHSESLSKEPLVVKSPDPINDSIANLESSSNELSPEISNDIAEQLKTAVKSISQPAVNPCSPRSRRSHVFMGLRNHGSTCYLNSVIQALFFTPEFREIVWQWNPTLLKNKSLAKALQTVFTDLKVSDEPVSTKIFFDSPEWEIRDLLLQMDVQELRHALFDRLEASISAEEYAKIKELFNGVLIDYIKCLECNTMKSREDSFQDLALSLRADGDPQSTLGSLESALLAFVEPEVLTGENQYSCDVCQRKCDALKGTALKTVPPILTVLLKRFDYNVQTNSKTKNNDRVEFPFFINVTDFLVDSDKFSENWANKIKENARVFSSDSDSEPVAKQLKSKSGRVSRSNSSGKLPATEATPTPPDMRMYELYAVHVHGGTLTGGHYYTFIKSMETKKWFKFNDQSVDEVTEESVLSAYGGRTEVRQGNAYMLQYRRVQENSCLVENSILPSAIEDFLENTANRKSVNLYYTETNFKMIFDVTRKIVWKTSSTSGPISVTDLFSTCLTHFGLKNTSQNLYRMVLFDPDTCLVGRSLDDTTEIIKADRHHVNIWLQVRTLDEDFPPCPNTQISPYVVLLDPTTREILNVKMCPVEVEISVQAFRDEIVKAFHIEEDIRLQLILDDYYTSPVPLNKDSTPLKDVVIGLTVRFYATSEPLGDEDFDTTELYDKVMALRCTSQICVILPPFREKEEDDIVQNDDDENCLFSCHDEGLVARDGPRRVVFTINHDGTYRWLRKKFADLLRLDRETESIILYTAKINNPAEQEELIGSYGSLAKSLDGRDLHKQNCMLRVVVQDETVKCPGKVSLLDVHNNLNHFSNTVDVAMERQATVSSVKKEVLKKMAEIHMIEIPFDMCRLRLLDRGCYVGRILHDKDKIKMYQDAQERDPHIPMDMCLQVVQAKDRLFSSKHESLFLFVQKYNAGDDSLGRVDEMYVASGSSNEFACQLVELSQIPEEHLIVLLAMTNFPSFVEIESYSRLATTWWPIGDISSWWERRVYTDGQLIFYRDVRVNTELNNNSTPQPEGAAISQGEGASTAQGEGAATAQAEGAATSHGEGTLIPQQTESATAPAPTTATTPIPSSET